MQNNLLSSVIKIALSNTDHFEKISSWKHPPNCAKNGLNATTYDEAKFFLDVEETLKFSAITSLKMLKLIFSVQ